MKVVLLTDQDPTGAVCEASRRMAALGVQEVKQDMPAENGIESVLELDIVHIAGTT